MNIAIIIVAGGTGSRMGSIIPKQFNLLCGKPVLMHTVEAFINIIPQCRIIIVLPEKETARWKILCKEHNFDIKHTVTYGGSSRYESVKNGLKLVQNCEVIGVHDGVRPLVSPKVILSALETAKQNGCGIPAIPVNDTLRKCSGDKDKSTVLDRNGIFAVQTPQFFQRDIIMDSYDTEFSVLFTDDASVIEAKGYPIILTEGDSLNIKLTTPSDMILAEAILSIN